MSLISTEKFLRTMEYVVNERGPGFVYATAGTSCYYRPQPKLWRRPDLDPRSQTGCLIGETLKRLLPPEVFEGLVEEETDADTLIVGTPLRDFFETPALVGRVARAAQFEQDQGETWGVARDAAVAESSNDSDYDTDDYADSL